MIIPALKQDSAQLVHQRCPLIDRLLTGVMQGLHVRLLLALESNEAHGRAYCRLGNRFGISAIILLGLDVRAADIQATLAEACAPEPRKPVPDDGQHEALLQ